MRKIAIFAVLLPLFALLEVHGRAEGSTPVYLNPNAPIEARVDDLLSRMTLKEKVGQLNLPTLEGSDFGRTIPEKMEAAKRFAAGTYTDPIGPGCGFFGLADIVLRNMEPLQKAEFFNALQKIALTQTRLKIPLLEDEEGTHGVLTRGSTIFPEGLAIGSAFDMPLVRAIYVATAQEARTMGIHVLSTLVLELDRDPRMGRNEEGYTEDPYLGSQIARNIVEGAQGAHIDAPDKAIALMTDFPTQSEPVSGLERGAIEFSERYIRENILPPWIAAFRAGALGVMAGYPEIDDVPAHSSVKWMNGILRHQLGFKGIVESEGDGFQTLIYEDIVPTQKQAGALALRAGVDLDITHEPAYMGPLIENVEEGKVPMWEVDRAVRRVLRVKFQLGLFEHPYVDADRAASIVHSKAHQELALRAAREGIVLLKNEQNLLPLRKNLKSIAVIGPNADSAANLVGDYAPRPPQQMETVLDGIKAKVSPTTRVVYLKGCGILTQDQTGIPAAVQAAKHSDVAILVVGEHQRRVGHGPGSESPTDGEAYDVASLDLTGVQQDLIKAVYATGTPTVIVLVNGRPLSVRWAAAHVPAIVEAWEPGERGGEAVADVLFGDYNPSGRLAVTIPRSVGQLPDYYNDMPSKAFWIEHGWSHLDGYVDLPGTPLYPFGYGLSYTHFQFSHLRIDPAQISSQGEAHVRVDVENTGTRAGVETVELYIHERYAPVSTPVKQLRGFDQVMLEPGQKKTVTFTLGPPDLQLLDRNLHWVVVPGTFDIMIGKSSADIALTGTLDVESSGLLAGYR